MSSVKNTKDNRVCESIQESVFDRKEQNTVTRGLSVTQDSKLSYVGYSHIHYYIYISACMCCHLLAGTLSTLLLEYSLVRLGGLIDNYNISLITFQCRDKRKFGAFCRCGSSLQYSIQQLWRFSLSLTKLPSGKQNVKHMAHCFII